MPAEYREFGLQKDIYIIAGYTFQGYNFGKFSVDEKRSNPTGDNLGSLLGLIKNLKFLFLSAISLAILGLAIVSGDGKNVVLNSYES